MTRSAVQQLAGIGKKLAHPPYTKDDILKQLKLAAGLLSEIKQSHGVVAAIESLTRVLILPMLTRHKDKDVRLLTTTCIMEIMRIVAPHAPYSDEELQEIFRVVVMAFEGLDEISSPSFARRSIILEIMANLRICVVMLDVGCDDLILEMFHIFFSVISDKHLSSVYTAMQMIMAAVLQESENIPLPLLDVILNNLLKHNKGVSAAAHKLAIGVVQQCAEKLEPYVQRLLTSVMVEGKTAEIDLHADYHDIIHEIYQWAPQMLLAVIPNLTQELVNDQVNVRLKAVHLLGRLFALPGQHVAKEYRQLFSEFLKRFTDKAVEVRLAMIDCANDRLKANPSGNEATEILAGLDDRILDNEEVVRLRVVVAICDVAKQNLKWMPVSLITHVAERLRDKKVLVRKEAFQRLAEVYRIYCTKCYEGSATSDTQLEWIPSKLVRCCYDKDVKEFRPAALEILFSENLFPRQLSVEDRARHWIAVYAAFEEIDKKALARVLSQKQRLQEDMSEFLSFRQKGKEMNKDDSHIQHLFKAMSLLFGDDHKAEESFQKLHNMKDKKVFKALSQLLDPNTSFTQSEEVNEDLLKRIGESHPQHEFMKMLALRCSFRIFGKEHAKSLLEQVISSRDSDNKDTVAAGLSLLSVFAGFFPFLIQDVKDDLLGLLLEGDDIIKERIADILARAGSSICGQIEEGSKVELTLQKLCLEGSRKQAKYAVTALAAVNADGGFKALSVLYGRLMENLQENNAHLPTVLQSLSCIAQNAITVFESQEDNIVRFVVRTLLLRRSCAAEIGQIEDGDWESVSPVCQLKIYGLKTLVKSFLPLKDHPRKRLRGLLGLLWKLLPNGEISEDSGSSEIDKAHLRLTSAIGVVRLARQLDAQIPPSLFHLCLLTGQDRCIQVRQQFLKKIHQYLKDHSLTHKYASAYALFASDSSKEVVADAKHYLADFIEGCRREARLLLQNSAGVQTEVYPITYSPEYVIAYLAHVLAYHPSFPGSDSKTADAYEPFYRILLFYLRSLVHQDYEGLGKKDIADNLPAIWAIFRMMKKAEDALEGKKTTNLRTICDLGIVITKELGRSRLLSETYPGLIPLPSSFYKLREVDEDDSCKVDGSDLPSCLNETNALSQFWSRGSRFGQVHALSSSPHPRRVKRDADEGSSSDLGEGDDAGEQVEQKRSSEAMQVNAEFEKSSKTVHIVDKTQKMKTLATSRRDQRDLRTSAALDSCPENGCVKVVNGASTLCTRHRRYDKAFEPAIPIEQEEGSFALDSGEKSTRGEKYQAVGTRIVLGSKKDKFIHSSPKSERGEKARLSKFHHRSVAKRLELDKQLDHIKDEGTDKAELNQKTLPEIFSMRKRSLRHRDGGNSTETGSREIIREKDTHPQTRSRKVAVSSDAEVLSQLQSTPEDPIKKKRKKLAAERVSLLLENGQSSTQVDNESTDAPAEQRLEERERSNKPTHAGRILRNRNIPQKESPKATEKTSAVNDESDQEPVATWRSRRRKVQ